MTPKSQGLNEHQARSQKALIEFLHADLDLCFTMLNSARMTRDPEHRRSAVDKVLAGMQVVRRLAVRIEDPQAAQGVCHRVNELERALD